MSTLTHALQARFAGVKKYSHEGTALRKVLHISENVSVLIATPFVGLLYVLTFALVGIGAVFCYGLKAVGMRCRIFNK